MKPEVYQSILNIPKKIHNCHRLQNSKVQKFNPSSKCDVRNGSDKITNELNFSPKMFLSKNHYGNGQHCNLCGRRRRGMTY